MAIAGKKALIKVVDNSAPTVFTDEATTTTDNLTYTITNTAKRIWDPSYTVVVEDGGTPTVESYTINRLKGTVTFGTATVRTITVTGKYLTVATVADAHEYTYTISADNSDVTTFGDNYIERQQTLKDLSLSISRYTTASQAFENSLKNYPLFVVEVYSNSATNWDFRAWANIASVENSGAVDGIQDSSLDFEGITDADNRCLTTY